MRERVKQRKQNMKIYSLYRMLSADHIFFYAIDFIFLTQIKNISAADIVLGQSFFALSTTLFQILAVFIIDKLGKRLSISLANLFLAIHVLLIMRCDTVGILLLAQFVDAIGFSIKDTADTSLLNNSIPETPEKGEIFSKIEGKGVKNFYYFSAISALIAGWLYGINPYIPLVLSFVTSIASAIMALGFSDLKEEKKNNENIDNIENKELEKEENKKETIIDYTKNLIDAFKFIFKSERLKALLLYSGIFNGVFFLMNTYIISLLEEIGAVAAIIAGFTFLKSIASGIGSNKQLDFHNRFKNTSLSKILIAMLICIFVVGGIGLVKGRFVLSLVVITIASLLMFFVKGIYDVLLVRYLQNFTNEVILTKIYAVNSFSRNVSRIAISFVGSYFLRITNTANSILLVGIMFSAIVVILITYMKPRVGLNPEDYDEKEINFS